MKTDNVMKRWLAAARPVERNQLAKFSGTTVGTLRQIAGGYRTRGKLQVSPELARKLEIASIRIRKNSKILPLPVLWRTDLCPACHACEFAKACGH